MFSRSRVYNIVKFLKTMNAQLDDPVRRWVIARPDSSVQVFDRSRVETLANLGPETTHNLIELNTAGALVHSFFAGQANKITLPIPMLPSDCLSFPKTIKPEWVSFITLILIPVLKMVYEEMGASQGKLAPEQKQLLLGKVTAIYEKAQAMMRSPRHDKLGFKLVSYYLSELLMLTGNPELANALLGMAFRYFETHTQEVGKPQAMQAVAAAHFGRGLAYLHNTGFDITYRIPRAVFELRLAQEDFKETEGLWRLNQATAEGENSLHLSQIVGKVTRTVQNNSRGLLLLA